MAQAPVGPTAAIARQIRELRRAQGRSGRQLAEAMTAQGIAWDRAVVANLENGRRRSVSVDEWLALAAVLHVSPLHLLVPIEGGEYQVTPALAAEAEEVRAWVRGDETQMAAMDGDAPDKSSWYARHSPAVERASGVDLIRLIRLIRRWNREGESVMRRIEVMHTHLLDDLGDAERARLLDEEPDALRAGLLGEQDK